MRLSGEEIANLSKRRISGAETLKNTNNHDAIDLKSKKEQVKKSNKQN